MPVGDDCSILLRLRGGAGDKESAPSLTADTSPAVTSTSLQYPPPPTEMRADGGSSSTPNGLDAEGAEDRMRAGVDNAVRRPPMATHRELLTQTAFFKALNVADLTAASKARSLHVVAASGSVKKADFVTALQAWIHSHSVVISSFQDAQLLGLEASTNWWSAYNADQDLQGLRFTVNDSVWNGMRRQVAQMLEINDNLRQFAPQHSQLPPAYQNCRQVPQWPQPSAAGNRSSDSFSSTQVPGGYDSSMGGTSWQSPEVLPLSWAAPWMQGFSVQDSHPRSIVRLRRGPGLMCRAMKGKMTLRPPGLHGRMCTMGSVECHDSQNRMHCTTLVNFQMGQDRRVRHPVIRTAKHTWRCKAL